MITVKKDEPIDSVFVLQCLFGLSQTISFLRVRIKWADTLGAYRSVRQDHHESSSWGGGVKGGGYSSRQKEKGWQKSLKVLRLQLHH